jgi:hypothetical protein
VSQKQDGIGDRIMDQRNAMCPKAVVADIQYRSRCATSRLPRSAMCGGATGTEEKPSRRAHVGLAEAIKGLLQDPTSRLNVATAMFTLDRSRVRQLHQRRAVLNCPGLRVCQGATRAFDGSESADDRWVVRPGMFGGELDDLSRMARPLCSVKLAHIPSRRVVGADVRWGLASASETGTTPCKVRAHLPAGNTAKHPAVHAECTKNTRARG